MSRHPIRFPGENEEYRAARDELLEAEIELRDKLSDVAARRSELPLGGPVQHDYEFDELVGDTLRTTKLSELFDDGKKSLMIYSFMYGPEAEQPCPMCTCFLDSADGSAPHLAQRINFAVVAKSPIHRIRDWAQERGWRNLRLLSSEKNSYNADYFGETPDGKQLPACNVFVRAPEGIRHFYSTELLYAGLEGQPRHVDLLWPLWNFFDLTPEGRGRDWMPSLSYESTRAATTA